MAALRVFFIGGLLSYRALFSWMSPWIFIPSLVITPVFQILLFAYIGRTAGVGDDRFFLIGTALQEPVLLSGSVRENIVLARDAIDDAEMLRASELSGTHAFMGQVANGYDLRLADRGWHRRRHCRARRRRGRPQRSVQRAAALRRLYEPVRDHLPAAAHRPGC